MLELRPLQVWASGVSSQRSVAATPASETDRSASGRVQRQQSSPLWPGSPCRKEDEPEEPLAAASGLGVLSLALFDQPELQGLEHYSHTGQNFGYEAMMIFLPEHKACVVALANDNTGSLEHTGLPLLGIVRRNLSSGE